MIDLRSDILGGIPEPALAAMAAAARDAPAFDLDEDPHQSALEEETAALFGFERGMFVPTGTMANQIALRLRCDPGEMVIAERGSHVTVNEAASTAGLNGVAVHALDGLRGHLDAATVATALASLPRSAADRRVGLVWLENTHNRAGGTVMPPSQRRTVVALCREAGVPLHMDGARIWNALLATGESPQATVEGIDSMAVSLNKGLGAPAGALLLGNAPFIAEARRVRRMFGGWWRPVGFLAAGARAAIAIFRERLATDHARAARFAARLREILPPGFAAADPETNVVMLAVPPGVPQRRLLEALRREGVNASDYGAAGIRFVFHARIADADIVDAADAIARGIASLRPATH